MVPEEFLFDTKKLTSTTRMTKFIIATLSLFLVLAYSCKALVLPVHAQRENEQVERIQKTGMEMDSATVEEGYELAGPQYRKQEWKWMPQ